jgi:hypothetical protein
MSKSDMTKWQQMYHGAAGKVKMKINFLCCHRGFHGRSTAVPNIRNAKGKRADDNYHSKFLVEVHICYFRFHSCSISLIGSE